MTIDAPQAAVVDDAFMQRFFDAWKRRDVEGILALVTDDVVLESAFGPEVHGKRFSGKEQFRAGILRYFETFPAIASTDRRYAILGDKGFMEVTSTFTSADGKQMTMRVCDLYEFRDGKVSSKRAYAKRISAA